MASNAAASAAHHLFEAHVHLVFFDEISGICLSEPMSNGAAEIFVVLEERQNLFSGELLRMFSLMLRDAREMRFLLGGKMEFHEVRVESGVGGVNELSLPRAEGFDGRYGFIVAFE